MEANKALAKWRIRVGQLFIVIMCVVILFTDSLWEESGIVGGALFLIGAILAGIATVGRLWCSLYISGYKNEALVTIGPYSMCRNPLYFFSLLGAIGVGLATKTVTIPAIIFILFVVYYPFVIVKEEGRLTRTHGSSFEKYRKKIPVFIPSFKHFEEPEEYTIRTIFLRARFTDSLWFMWLVGLIVLIESLHRHEIVKVYFRLY